jgi:hypothetical protein
MPIVFVPQYTALSAAAVRWVLSLKTWPFVPEHDREGLAVLGRRFGHDAVERGGERAHR